MTEPADLAWLDALIWPNTTTAGARLHMAAAIAAADPPLLVRCLDTTDVHVNNLKTTLN